MKTIWWTETSPYGLCNVCAQQGGVSARKLLRNGGDLTACIETVQEMIGALSA